MLKFNKADPWDVEILKYINNIPDVHRNTILKKILLIGLRKDLGEYFFKNAISQKTATIINFDMGNDNPPRLSDNRGRTNDQILNILQENKSDNENIFDKPQDDSNNETDLKKIRETRERRMAGVY